MPPLEEDTQLALDSAARLEGAFDAAISQGGTLIFEIRDLAKLANVDRGAASSYLANLAARGVVEEIELCRCESCGERVEDSDSHVCSAGPRFKLEHFSAYRYVGTQSRDPRSLMFVHGMNTRGEWQEELAFKVTLAYGYAVPVCLFKYGRILLSPFLTWRHDVYVQRFVESYHEKRVQLASVGLTGPPDIIAHSFGTLIVSRALERDKTVTYGRVVLTGSILRPDFDWRGMRDRGRVEAVLCHCALRDIWVRVAPFFIPGSGPSGAIGFTDSAEVHNVESAEFAHSDFFADEHFAMNLKSVWAPFLQMTPMPREAPPRRDTTLSRWYPSVWYHFGQIIKCAVLIAIPACVIVALGGWALARL